MAGDLSLSCEAMQDVLVNTIRNGKVMSYFLVKQNVVLHNCRPTTSSSSLDDVELVADRLSDTHVLL